MADIWSKRKRSEVMALIRSHGNKATELRLITIMRAAGNTGWRRKQPLTGKPDFIFRKQRVAVFVDGCFWHGCPRHGTKPASNRAFWRKKFTANKARDQRVSRELRRQGWCVLRIWEHELKKPSTVVGRVKKILQHHRKWVAAETNHTSFASV